MRLGYIFFLFTTFIALLHSFVAFGESGLYDGQDRPITVMILNLHNGDRIHGEIRIEAQVNHPEKIKYVEFYIQEPDEKDRYGWKSFAPPYVWGGANQTLNTLLFNDGLASVVAFCYDLNNRLVAQERVNFTIDNGKPAVKILSPRDNATVGSKELVEITAGNLKGISRGAGIAAVYVYLDGKMFRKITAPPFRVEIQPCLLSGGLHSIRAVAEDTEGHTGVDSIMIKIPESVSVYR